MKKIFLAFLVAGSLAACNNEGASTENMEDSMVDHIDSTYEAKVDSLQETSDSLQNAVENADSATLAH